MSEAESRLGGLTFGTSGLRAPLGEGPGRMNRQVVAHTAAGLAAWLAPRADAPTVVVGHDARHESDVFAHECAQVLAGAGVRTLLLDGPVPTPVLAFAVGHLGASAGVMITASHNPATDNGLKVYLDDTTQVAAPDDEAISARIAATPPFTDLPRSSAWEEVGAAVVSAYVDAVAGPQRAASQELVVAYTPLHGVGADVFLAAAARHGHTDIRIVAEQAVPDPAFPTVAYPNPEEPGTLDRVLALARQVQADVVIAHDPDADRCAVAVSDGGQLTVLTGDELGILLADHLLRHGFTGTYASSVVSSSFMGALAAAHGQPWQQTLTGFKWLGKVPDLAFAYEEALGYCVAPGVVRDKDGISAALAVLDLVSELRASGKTLLDRLGELFATHGERRTRSVSLRLASHGHVLAAMRRLRADPPALLGEERIASVDDFSPGFGDLPPADLLRLNLQDARVIIRPSGTEPMMKAYVEARDRSACEALATDVRELLEALAS
ncbi:MAG TPA: phospho-sugar mutase [Aeromicrobium sp.]|nr:phospho-sugar mutase [Aeromicrobium sp.]